jgi:hypothetical protein
MTAGVLGRRQVKHRAPRRKNGPNRPAPATPVNVVSATKTGSTLAVVLSQPASLKGLPAYTTNVSGLTVTAASLTNPTTLSLTFSGALTTATSLIVPFEEPAIRSASGGYLTSGTFPVT